MKKRSLGEYWNKMEKLIVTDADGVLLDWENHFHAYMRSHGHERAYGNNTYWQEMNYPTLSKDEARKMVYHFNTSAWIVDMPAFRDSRSGVASLVEAGYKFVAITAMGDDPYSKQVREINLERMFGYDVFEDVICTDMYDPNSKVEALTKFGGFNHPWIEDKPSNAELGANMGYRSFLMLHKHNEDYEPVGNIESVSSWGQLCDIILDTD